MEYGGLVTFKVFSLGFLARIMPTTNAAHFYMKIGVSDFVCPIWLHNWLLECLPYSKH